MPDNTGVSFGILQPAPMSQTQVMTMPQQGGGDSGIGGILSGLSGLFKGIGGAFGSNPVSTANHAVNTAMQATPTSQVANSVLPGSGNALAQQESQSPISNQQVRQSLSSNGAPGQQAQTQGQGQQHVQISQPAASSLSLNMPQASNPNLNQSIQNLYQAKPPFIPATLNQPAQNPAAQNLYSQYRMQPQQAQQAPLQAQNLRGYNPQGAQQAVMPQGLNIHPNIPNQPKNPNILQANNLQGFNRNAAQQATLPQGLQINPQIPNQPANPNILAQPQTSQATPSVVDSSRLAQTANLTQPQPNISNIPQVPNAQPQTTPLQTSLSNVPQPVNNDNLHQTMSAIAQIETGGAKNPYVSTTPAGHGLEAVGKYQVLSSNIPSWTKEALGHSMTSDQFKNNPQAQEQTAAYQMNQMLKQGHNPNDVASMWFTGKPLKQAGTSVKDNLGTSNGDYQNQFNKYFNQKPQVATTENVGQNNIHNAVQAAATNASPYEVASKYIGDGRQSHADVLGSFFQKSGQGNVNIQTTPWCAAFANSVLKASGFNGTNSLSAKSFLNWGKPTSNPGKGDIAVFNDLTGKNDPTHGHVGFVDSVYTKGNQQFVRTLGGNESGKVMIKDYPMSKVAGFRTAPTTNEIASRTQQTQMQQQNLQQTKPQVALNDANDRLLPPAPQQPQTQLPAQQTAPQRPLVPGLSNGQLRVASNPASANEESILAPFMQSLQ